MPAAAPALNPFITTNAAGLFNVKSDGLVAGVAMDDPTVRNLLCGGVLSTVDSIPMLGGVPICENVPSNPADVLGGLIQRATSISSTIPVTGFSVLNQAHAGLTTPQNPVPVFVAGQTVNFYRLGSNARIAVPCDPGLVNLDGSPINQQVSWDFHANVLQKYDAATATVSVTSLTATYLGGNLWNVVVVAAAASDVQAVGDWITISGATNTGTGGAAALNITTKVTAFVDNENFTFQVTGPAGYLNVIAGTILLQEGIGALPCKILTIQPTGCMVPLLDPAGSGNYTWDTNGCAALILI